MSDNVEQIADAVMYEGYNLYPYRPSSIKNQYRWTFGVLCPRLFCERHSAGNQWEMQTECLVIGRPHVTVDVNVRFLQLTVPAAEATGFSWQESTPREVAISIRLQESDGVEAKEIDFAAIEGAIELSSTRLSDDLFKITLKVQNVTPWTDDSCDDREKLLLRSLVSTHSILSVRDAEFVSLLDPPDKLCEAAAACQNVGAWPVLVGDRDSRQTMLASPIILYDYPKIAPESHGDLFDGTEIDEILSLRIQTLTDDEKREMATVDERTRQLLQRTQSMAGEDLLNLHGTFRESPVQVAETGLQPGSRVRLCPSGRADAFDILLNGKTATVVSVEQDYENTTYVTVTVDDDPGRDFGREGQIAHRFFFRLDEVEPVGETARRGAPDPAETADRRSPFACGDLRSIRVWGRETRAQQSDIMSSDPRILIAGIGNIFHGDDAFGVELAKRVAARDWPEGVRVVDFGIRGLDLGYALLDNYDAVILLDATSRGDEPGTLFVIEPEVASSDTNQQVLVETHAMVPEKVLRWAKSMGAHLPYIRIIGCEPAMIGSEDDMVMGLSEAVESVLDEAVGMVEEQVRETYRRLTAVPVGPREL